MTCPECHGAGTVEKILEAIQHVDACKGKTDGSCEGKPPCEIVRLPTRSRCPTCVLLRGPR